MKQPKEQLNYVLDENEIIGKGPNGTLSLIFDGIKKLNKSSAHFCFFDPDPKKLNSTSQSEFFKKNQKK